MIDNRIRKKTLKIAALIISFQVTICSCAPARQINDNEIEVKYISSSVGTVTFYVYAKCINHNLENCIKEAKKDAIRAILFKGIPGSDYPSPLIKDGEANHAEYFKNFFRDNGEYLKFISLTQDTRLLERGLSKFRTLEILTTIQKDELRKALEKSNIIKPLDYGF